MTGFAYNLFRLILFSRVASQPYAKLVEYFMIHFSKHYSGMHLASAKFRKSLKSFLTSVVLSAEHRESHQYLIRMQTPVAVCADNLF